MIRCNPHAAGSGKARSAIGLDQPTPTALDRPRLSESVAGPANTRIRNRRSKGRPRASRSAAGLGMELECRRPRKPRLDAGRERGLVRSMQATAALVVNARRRVACSTPLTALLYRT